MNDKPLFATLISILQSGLSSQGVTVGIQKAYQPTQQNVPISPCLLLHKVSDRKYGFTMRNDVWNNITRTYTHNETDNILTTVQIGCIATENPADLTGLTASDYVNAAACVLQSEPAIAAFHALNIGIDKITNLRQTFFKDEQGMFEASPSFDVTLTHSRLFTIAQPSAKTYTTVFLSE